MLLIRWSVTTQCSSVSVFLLDDRSVDPGHDGAVPDPDHRLPHSTRGFPEDPVHPSVSGRRRPVTATAHTAAGGAGGSGTDTLIHTCFFALLLSAFFLALFFFLLCLFCLLSIFWLQKLLTGTVTYIAHTDTLFSASILHTCVHNQFMYSAFLTYGEF